MMHDGEKSLRKEGMERLSQGKRQKQHKKCENEISKMKNAYTWVESRRWKFNFEILSPRSASTSALEPIKLEMNVRVWLKNFITILSWKALKCSSIWKYAIQTLPASLNNVQSNVHVQSTFEGIRKFQYLR